MWLPSVSVGDETKSLLHRVQGSERTGDRKAGVRGAGAEPRGRWTQTLGAEGWLCAHTGHHCAGLCWPALRSGRHTAVGTNASTFE